MINRHNSLLNQRENGSCWRDLFEQELNQQNQLTLVE